MIIKYIKTSFDVSFSTGKIASLNNNTDAYFNIFPPQKTLRTHMLYISQYFHLTFKRLRSCTDYIQVLFDVVCVTRSITFDQMLTKYCN